MYTRMQNYKSFGESGQDTIPTPFAERARLVTTVKLTQSPQACERKSMSLAPRPGLLTLALLPGGSVKETYALDSGVTILSNII